MTQNPVPESVRALYSGALTEELLDLRRDLHRHPELSFQESRTQEKLRKRLDEFDPQDVAGTGLIARIRGKNSGAPVVALRGDIDALPIHEETGVPHASENPGVMHACGHDVHATWMVAAAKLLKQNPADGDILILLQPAEEIGEGALRVLESGALDGVRCIFGGHVDRRFSVGEVVADAGPLCAATDSFEIVLTGQGAHGARPHEARDPVVGLAALVQSLQTIVSRRLNPDTPAVVTVGKVEAGSAPNIIPESAAIQGTLRSLEPETRQLLVDEVRRIARAVADAHHLTAEFRILNGTPPVINPPEAAAWAQAAAESVLGSDALKSLGFLNMGGEDFAYYMERIPGCFLRIGAREDGGEATAAHSPYFYAADECIFTGAAVLAECARRASAALA